MSNEIPSLWEAARQEMQEYQLGADLRLQPQWDVPETIGLHAAVSGRQGADSFGGDGFPSSLESFQAAAASVIEAGATSVHFDYTWIRDPSGRRIDKEMNPVEAYRTVIDPLKEKYGTSFIVDCNVLNGRTFDECMGPAREGINEIAPCAAGHPDVWMIPAIKAVQEVGVKPMIAIHSSGEVELAKRKLIDTGILEPPYYFNILYGLPFNSGRTLVSGTYTPNFRDMALHLFLMVDQLKAIAPDPVISVCAAGRATLYMTTVATLLGIDVRVGTEDTIWKYPNSDELVESNLQLFNMAKEIAALHGRRPATADEYRQRLGLKTPVAA